MKSCSNYESADGRVLGSVTAVKVFVVIRHRNSYYGYESRNYRLDAEAGFACSAKDAKLLAEGWRAPGSSFAIEEVPTLLVSGADRGFVLMDFYASDPFHEWRPHASFRLEVGMPLIEALLSFWVGGPWRGVLDDSSLLRCETDDSDAFESVTLSTKFRSWRSSPGTGGSHMVWSAVVKPHSPASVLRIQKGVRSEPVEASKP